MNPFSSYSHLSIYLSLSLSHSLNISHSFSLSLSFTQHSPPYSLKVFHNNAKYQSFIMFHFPSVPLTSKLFLLIILLFGRVRERYKLSCTTRAWQEAIAKDLSPIRGSVLELHRILNSQNPEPRTQNPNPRCCHHLSSSSGRSRPAIDFKFFALGLE